MSERWVMITQHRNRRYRNVPAKIIRRCAFYRGIAIFEVEGKIDGARKRFSSSELTMRVATPEELKQHGIS